MNMNVTLKRAACLFLAAIMLLSAVPTNAFALAADQTPKGGSCEHHTVHEGCGYVAAIPGQPCIHTHDNTCGYAEGKAAVPCDHTHGGEECGAPAVSYPNCAHSCGDGQCDYVAAVAGVDCDHSHTESCGAADEAGKYPDCIHTSHDDCAYVAAVEGVSCNHTHGGEECGEPATRYPNCGHTHGSCAYSEEVKASPCAHAHNNDCGFVQAVEGKPCNFVCQECSKEAKPTETVAPTAKPEPTQPAATTAPTKKPEPTQPAATTAPTKKPEPTQPAATTAPTKKSEPTQPAETTAPTEEMNTALADLLPLFTDLPSADSVKLSKLTQKKKTELANKVEAALAALNDLWDTDPSQAELFETEYADLVLNALQLNDMLTGNAASSFATIAYNPQSGRNATIIVTTQNGTPITNATLVITRGNDTFEVYNKGNGEYVFTRNTTNNRNSFSITVSAVGYEDTTFEMNASTSSTTVSLMVAEDLSEAKYADFAVYYIATGQLPSSYAGSGDASDYGPSGDDVPLVTIRVDIHKLRREYADVALYQTNRDGNEWQFVPNDSGYSSRLAAVEDFWDAVWACTTSATKAEFEQTGLAGDFDGYVLKRMSGGSQHCDGILKVSPPVYVIEYYDSGTYFGGSVTDSTSYKTMDDVWNTFKAHFGIDSSTFTKINNEKATYLKDGRIYTITIKATTDKSKGTQTHNGIVYGKRSNLYYMASFNATVTAGADNWYTVTYTDGVTTEFIFNEQITDHEKGSKVPAFASPDALQRKGYTFQGWVQSDTGDVLTDEQIAAMTVTKDLTFHAKWNQIPTSFTATVNVLLNDASKTDIGDLMESATKLYLSTDGATFTELTRSAQGEYTAEVKNGTWYVYASSDGASYTKLDDGALVINNAPSSRDLRFFSVSYDLNGGTVETEIPVTYHLRNTRVNVTATQPTKEDYLFQNWTAGADTYESGSLLTASITAPYTLVAQWEATVDVKVRVTFHYSSGNSVDNAQRDISFALEKLVGNLADSTGHSRTLREDNCPNYEFSDDTSTHIAVYEPTGITFENMPEGKYTVECIKSDYDITITPGDVVDGVQTIDVVLQFTPENFDIDFAVRMDEDTPLELYPQAVNVKVTYWGYNAQNELGWHIITQQQSTSSVRVSIDPATGTGSGSYPVWQYWSGGEQAYEYRIVITSYVMPDGTLVAANEAEANLTYISDNGTYTGRITVENGGRTPSYPAGSNTALTGGYYDGSKQIGIPTATISVTAYRVSFVADTVENGKVENKDTYTLDNQLKIPEFQDFAMTLPGTGYLFEGWYTADGTESGDWGQKATAGTALTEDVTLYAKWKAPLTVQGTVHVAGSYVLDGVHHSINAVDRTAVVRINLRKQGSTAVFDTFLVPITYKGDLGTGTYAFTGLADDGTIYYIEEVAANYSGLYRNEPNSLTTSTAEADYAAGRNTALDSNSDNTAVVDAYLPFSPASFDLQYRVDATAIGEEFRPDSTEVLVTYDDGNHGIAPDQWAVISQMKFSDSYTGNELPFAAGIAEGSTSVWNSLADGSTAYEYGIRLQQITGIPAAQGEAVPYTITYKAPAHWSGSTQSTLLTATLTPKTYSIRYDLGVEATAVTGMDKAPTEHTWSFATDLSGVTPVRPGFEFLGWFTEDDEPVTSIDASVAEDTVLYAKWYQMQDVVNMMITIVHSTDDGTTGEAGNYDKDLLVQLTRAEANSSIFQDVPGKFRSFGKQYWHVLGDDADQEIFEVSGVFSGLPSEFDYDLDVSLDGYYVEYHHMEPQYDEETHITTYNVQVTLVYKPDLLNFTFHVKTDEHMDASLRPVSAVVKVTCWFDPPSTSLGLDWNTITQHYDSTVTVALDSSGKGTGSYPVWQWLNQTDNIPYYYRIEVISLTFADGNVMMYNAPEGSADHDVVYSGGSYSATIETSDCGIPQTVQGSTAATALSGAYGNAAYIQQGKVTAVITCSQAQIHFQSADEAMGTVSGQTEQVFSLDADSSGNYSGSVTPADEKLVLTPAADYIVFSHWTDEAGETVDPFVARTMNGGQVQTYTAHWKVNDACSYTVKYLEQGTGTTLHEAETVTGVQYGTSVTAASKQLSIDGYVFDSASADTLTVGLEEANNVLILYYAKDQFDDANDSETGGDGIADYKQIVIRFCSESNGSVSGKTTQVITLTQTNAAGSYVGSVTPDAVTITADAHYIFHQWMLQPGDLTMTGEADPYSAAHRLQAEGGNTYTYTVSWQPRSYSYQVKYVDQYGYELAPTENRTVVYDPNVTITETRKEISGYKAPAGSENQVELEYVDGQLVIFYYMKKNYDLTVHYVDIADNKTIHESTTVTGLPFQSEPNIEVLQKQVSIAGYTYVDSVPSKLVIEDREDNSITLRYKLNTYPITVCYYYDGVMDPSKSIVTSTKYGYGTVIDTVWSYGENYNQSGKDYVLHAITGTDVAISDNTATNTVHVYYRKDVLVDNEKQPETDGIGDGIPDIYQSTVTYEVVNGSWVGQTELELDYVFTLYERDDNGIWQKLTGQDAPTLANTVPTGKAADGFADDNDTATWNPVEPTASTEVTGDARYVLIYSKAETHGITVTVVGGSAKVGSESKDDHFTIYVNDENFASGDVDQTVLSFQPDDGYILWSVTVDNAPAQLTDGSYTFRHDGDHSITVVYEKDTVGGEDGGDEIPDRFQKKITYRIVNGTWNGTDSTDIVDYVTLMTDGQYDVNGSFTIAADPYPNKAPVAGYENIGSWTDDVGAPVTFPKTVSGLQEELFIFTYSQKVKVTVKIEVEGGTSYPVASETVYEYTTDTTTVEFTPFTDHVLVSAKIKLGSNDWTDLTDDFDGEITHNYTQNVHIQVVYKLDRWSDPKDSETDGDKTPDEQQALVKFQTGENGSVGTSGQKTAQVYTMGEDNTLSQTFEAVTAVPDNGYRLSHWVDTHGKTYSEQELFETAHTLEGDNTYVFTAMFTEAAYSYTVEYYFDGAKDDSKTETVQDVLYNTLVTLNPANRTGEDNMYLLEKVEPQTLTVSYQTEKNLIKVYYVTDRWNDADDSETGGDDIPDKYQALIRFVSAGNGTVEGATSQVFTLNTAAGKIWTPATVEPKPDTGYVFDLWQDSEGASVKPFRPTTLSGGQVVVYTAVFAKDLFDYTVEYYYDGVLDDSKTVTVRDIPFQDEVTLPTQADVQGDYMLESASPTALRIDADESKNVFSVYYVTDVWADGDTDSETGGDKIPDKYQALVKFVSADETKGAVTGNVVQVTTFPDGQLSGTVVPSLENVLTQGKTADDVHYAFDYWTRDFLPVPTNPAVALEQIQGGTTITFRAHFDQDDYRDGDLADTETPDDITGGDNVPDKYQAKVIYMVDNGTWSDGTNADITEVFTLYRWDPSTCQWNKVEATLGETVPQNMLPNTGYQNPGTWDEPAPAADTLVIGDTVYVYRYGADARIFYYITVTVENGDADVTESPIKVFYGEDQTINFTAHPGYALDTVTVDGESAQLTDGGYTFETVLANHTIYVVYAQDNWKDAEQTLQEDTDSETGGDGIADRRQAIVKFEAGENGAVQGQTLYVLTMAEDNGLFKGIFAAEEDEVTAVPDDGYKLDRWTLTQDIRVRSADTAAMDPYSDLEVVGGGYYVYTALFTERLYIQVDPNGGTWNDNAEVQKIEVNDPETELPQGDPLRYGYLFREWTRTEGEDGSDVVYIYTAQWDIDYKDITYPEVDPDDGEPEPDEVPLPATKFIEVRPNGGSWLGSTKNQRVEIAEDYALEDPEWENHLFMGWKRTDGTEENVVYVFTAMWEKDIVGGYDEDHDPTGDGIPDKYQKKVIFEIEGGYWKNESWILQLLGDSGNDADIVVWLTLVDEDGNWDQNGTAELTSPTGMYAKSGYHKGKWDETPPEYVEGTDTEVFTYRFRKISTGTNPTTGEPDMIFLCGLLMSGSSLALLLMYLSKKRRKHTA